MSDLALQSFGFEDHLVRVIDQAGAPWFIAQDICAVLEINNHRQVVSRLDDDEKGVTISDTLGGRQEVSIISESGLYALIFKSRKAAAVRFRKWVTSEVLPTLRRTGEYQMPVANDDDRPVILPFLDSADEVDRFRSALAAVRECRIVHGRSKAKRLWPILGLPEAPRISMNGVPELSAPRSRNIARWAEERLAFEPGARIAAHELRDDYENWCEANDVCAEGVQIFWKCLTDFGYASFHSNGSWRRDCRLKD
ncbi:BRO-N domain-containing protein [Sphingorhabdus sp. 109]|uniref:BRO-N domain-containing protein n=1 Tax=Sphingorhabdus sp. 109 TaxID=2653173 RepID=UPI0012F47606|nr:Bro-N domain-containing protein [Sphingorhabdus sp. 109]VWX56724.1 conserved hypothetical protein [Sphingorhabdus sp. 109]